jgi:hypothetical protein
MKNPEGVLRKRGTQWAAGKLGRSAADAALEALEGPATVKAAEQQAEQAGATFNDLMPNQPPRTD